MVEVFFSTVAGNVEAEGVGHVTCFSSEVSGSVAIKDSAGPGNLISDCTVAGDIKIEESAALFGPYVMDNTVHGNVEIKDKRGGGDVECDDATAIDATTTAAPSSSSTPV